MSFEKLNHIQTRIIRGHVQATRPIDIFQVNLATDKGTWDESFGSEAELKAFLRGVQAGCDLSGKVYTQPEIPQNPKEMFVAVPTRPEDTLF